MRTNQRLITYGFLNAGHALDHFFLLIYPVAVLSLEDVFQATYGELLTLSVYGFVAFGAGAMPAGWLGDRWSRRGMMTIFFIGIGIASILTGFARSPLEIALGLTLIGVFASIYHPVGIAMVADAAPERLGKALGINGVFGNLGVALAGVTTGVIVDTLGWQAAFIIPGAVSVVVGMAFLVCTAGLVESHSAKRPPTAEGLGRQVMLRIFVAMVVASIFGMFIFNSMTVSLPKVFDVRLADMAQSATGIGSLVTVVFTVAAVAQIVVGYMIDTYPLKRVFVGVAVVQVPMMAMAVSATEMGMLALAVGIMLIVFGSIPINDTIIARYATGTWRSRVYAVKFTLGLGISAATVPLVGWIHDTTGGFHAVFWFLTASAVVVALCAIAFPGASVTRRPAAAQPSTSAAE